MAAGLRQQLPQSMTHVGEWSSVLCWPLSPAHHEGDHQRGPPWLKQQGKSISSWQGLETFKAMVHNGQFSTLRIPKGTMDFICLEGKAGKNPSGHIFPGLPPWQGH